MVIDNIENIPMIWQRWLLLMIAGGFALCIALVLSGLETVDRTESSITQLTRQAVEMAGVTCMPIRPMWIRAIMTKPRPHSLLSSDG